MNRVDEINQAKGFMKPVYWQYGEDGRPQYGLGPDDYFKIENGYGCPSCLADFGGVYRIVCPVCHAERNVEADFFNEPDYWKPDPTDPDRKDN